MRTAAIIQKLRLLRPMHYRGPIPDPGMERFDPNDTSQERSYNRGYFAAVRAMAKLLGVRARDLDDWPSR